MLSPSLPLPLSHCPSIISLTFLFCILLSVPLAIQYIAFPFSIGHTSIVSSPTITSNTKTSHYLHPSSNLHHHAHRNGAQRTSKAHCYYYYWRHYHFHHNKQSYLLSTPMFLGCQVQGALVPVVQVGHSAKMPSRSERSICQLPICVKQCLSGIFEDEPWFE